MRAHRIATIAALVLMGGVVSPGGVGHTADDMPGAAHPQVAAAPAGHDHHVHQPQGVVPTDERDLRPQIPDPVLVDQHGKRHHFYSDLVKGKLVVMNSIYTSCGGTCPVQTAIFAQVQRMLGDRVGHDVQMLSVSLDPVTDTPERLDEFAARFGVGPGWLFLTGSRADVTEVLQAMDLYSADPKEHTPMAAIGHEPAGLWMKLINLTAPGDIVGRLDRIESLGKQRLAAQ